MSLATAARIDALVQAGSLDTKFGREMISALQVFMEFRLRTQLRALHRGTMEPSPSVRLDEITTADRDMLRDALRVVRQFRELVRNHYNLGVSEWRAGCGICFIASPWEITPIDFLFEPGPPDEVVVLDCETTGLNPKIR